MEKKIKQVLNKYIIVLALILFHAPEIVAQSISAPSTFTPVPCGGGTSVQYSGSICLNSCYYQNAAVEFTYTGFAGGNFTVELSDETGSFASPTILNPGGTAIAASPGRINFNWPQTVAGNAYKIRVKCNAISLTSSSTPPFPAYFKIYNDIFWLNNQTPTAIVCSGGGGYTLTVDNPTPSVQSSSPANYPSLKYKWYKGTAPAVLIPGEITKSLTVFTDGIYHAELDYGVCSTSSSITRSQDVDVHFQSGSGSFTVSSSQGTSFCPSTPTVLSTQAGYTYQWFKDNVAIPSATSNTYTTAEGGSYHVLVGQGSCSATSNTIVLTPTDFNLSIDAPSSFALIPGDTRVITVTTDAANPTYQWYTGTPLAPISLETNVSYTATTTGNYKVVVNQNGTGCDFPKEILFTITEGSLAVKIPNVISPNNDTINDVWQIPQEFISPTTEVLIMNSVGEIVLQTKNYANNWPTNPIEFKSINPVFYYIITKEGAEAKKGSITVIK